MSTGREPAEQLRNQLSSAGSMPSAQFFSFAKIFYYLISFSQNKKDVVR